MVEDNQDMAKNWPHRLRECSLQDLVAIFLPYMMILTDPVIIACFILDPTMNLLLYSALPTSYQNWLSFSICLVEETRLLGFCMGIVTPVWQLQVVAFDLICHTLQTLIESAQVRHVKDVEHIFSRLRCLQLYIKLLNTVNGKLIFTWKLLSLGLSIVSGFAAIAHFKDRLIFGIMYYAIFLDAVLIYALLYEKAFKVPELFDKLRKLLGRQAGRHGTRFERKFVQRQVMAIPLLGIKVGEFHMLERMSTPMFFHYVLINVVSMLVAYG